MRLFFCAIALCLTIITLGAQDYSEAAEKARSLTNEQLGLATENQDSVVINLTALQQERIAKISQARAEVDKQYQAKIEALQSQFVDIVSFIVDAKGLDIKGYEDLKTKPDKLIFRKPKKKE